MVSPRRLIGLALLVAVGSLTQVVPAAEPGLYEMRVYYSPEGKLDRLHARFRDHTMKLFAKHGMTNLVYWHRAEGSPHADRMLVYLLAHPSRDAAKASFDAFRQDPDWTAAKTASETKAGGSLTEAKDGVLSEFLVPTDYSPWK